MYSLPQDDTSYAVKLRCAKCKRKTEHFGLGSPEGETLLLLCVNCGTIHTPLRSEIVTANRRKSLMIGALAAGALATLIGAAALFTLARQKRTEGMT